MNKGSLSGHVVKVLCAAIIVLPVSGVSVASEAGSYGTIGAGVVAMDLPENNFFADRGEANPFTRNYDLDTDDGRAYGAAVDGRIGTYLPVAIGHYADSRVALPGFWLNANSDNNAFFSDTGAGMRFGWVELNNSNGFGTPDTSTLTTKIRQDVVYWGFDVPVLMDFGMGPAASWSFQVGPSFKRLEQDTDAHGDIRNAGGSITTQVSLDDRLSTDFRGLMFGARYNRDLNSYWSVSVDASVAKYWSRVDYDGKYVDSFNATQNASVQESDDAVGVDLRLEIGRKLSSGLKVSAFGQINHLSDVPQVNYGSVPADAGNGVLRLESDDMTTLILGVQLSGSF